MSTFYLLPPRPFLGEHLTGYLAAWFPGLSWDRDAPLDLADLVDIVAGRSGIFIVHREELPDGEDTARALIDGFGAEPGDEVVEVRSGGRPGELTARRWRLGDAAA